MYRYKPGRNFHHYVLPVLLLLSACGDPNFNSSSSTTSTTTTDGNTTNSIRFGSTISGTFTDGIAQVTPTTISAAGTAAVSVELVDAAGAPSTVTSTVTFSSPCVTAGAATLSNPSFLTNTGTASTNYTSVSCTGSDVITATLSDTTQSASANITIAAATAGSIQFSSVSNSLIALSGTGSTSGLPENTTVKFIVKDGLGLPVKGEAVTFSLNNTVGGISLSSTVATTDGTGEVNTTVQSGNVATSVRVTATLISNPALITTSAAISIATGPPDQDSFSLSANELNPRAWDRNGKEVTITAYLADRYNNPITDGTSISFTTELGAIDARCTTTNGSCSVKWRSQNPRVNSLSFPGPAGITSILATVEGEESFLDVDVNGTFSNGDSFTDLGEAYRDDNDNGIYDPGEYLADINVNAAHDAANTYYNGKGCSHTTLCDTVTDSITVRGEIRLVMAEDNADISDIYVDGALQSTYPTLFDTTSSSSISFKIGGSVNQQILPVGSTVNFTATNGKIVVGSSHTVGNAVTGADTYTVYIVSDDKSSSDGYLNIEVTIGDGGQTFSYIPIAITD